MSQSEWPRNVTEHWSSRTSEDAGNGSCVYKDDREGTSAAVAAIFDAGAVGRAEMT